MTPVFLSLFLCAAPVPPPLARLEPHHLVGVWDYAWQDCPDGEIVFSETGCYVSRHRPQDGGGYTHAGRWELADDGRTLTLRETSLTDGWGWHHLTPYVVVLDVRRYPALHGATEGGSRFSFTNPKRGSCE